MIGNEEKTEERLKNTSQEGTVKMSIKNLYTKIAYKNEQNSQDVIFIWKSGIPQQRVDEQQVREEEEYKPEECERQLDTIKEYIEGFNSFMKLLNEPVEYDRTGPGQKSKQTYYQRMLNALENPKNDACRAVQDEIEDFKIFDPTAPGNR